MIDMKKSNKTKEIYKKGFSLKFLMRKEGILFSSARIGVDINHRN